MAIKYVVNEKKKCVTAILEGTKYDAVNRINNRLHNTGWVVDVNDCNEKFMMPDKFVATIFCDERDEFDAEFGEQRAKKVVLDNYYKSMNKRIKHFEASIRVLVQRFPECSENNT